MEAIDYYNRALKVVGANLSEKDAELGRLWGDLAIAHHLKRDLDNARGLLQEGRTDISKCLCNDW
jgi:hypothetical protein